MTPENNLSSKRIPQAVLMGDVGPFTFQLSEFLKAQNCQVTVLGNKKANRKKSFFKSNESKYELQIMTESTGNFSSIDYLIYLLGSGILEGKKKELEAMEQDITTVLGLAKKYGSKTMFIFPYSQDRKTYDALLPITEKILEDEKVFSAIIFLGHLVSLDNVDDGNYRINYIFKNISQSILSKTIKIEHIFYPIQQDLITEEIVKRLFSLGVYGKKSALLSEPIKAKEIQEIFQKYFPENSCFDRAQNLKTFYPEVDKKIIIDGESRQLIEELVEKYFSTTIAASHRNTSKDFENIQPEIAEKIVKKGQRKYFKQGSRPGVFSSKFFFKWTPRIFISVLLILLFPIISLVISLTFLLLSKKVFLTGNFQYSRFALTSSSFFSEITEKYCSFFSNVYLIEEPYQYLIDQSKTIKEANKIGFKGLSLINNFFDLSEKVFQKGNISLDEDVERISLDIDSLSRDLGFLQAEIQNTKGFSKNLIKNFDLEVIRKKLLASQKLIDELPFLLGKEKPIVYLILFQNNTTLRSTGGLIDSYGLATFVGGEISKFEIYSTALVDKNLQGIIEPPKEIEEYMNETNWFLRSSNWDPNFPTSAGKAGWFLDKGQEEVVDGVIAIDAEFIRLLIDKLNSLSFQGEKNVIQANSFYEQINSLTEDVDYPFSDKETSYTNIVKEIFLKPIKLQNPAKIKLAEVIVNSLDKKNIQIFLHNNNGQRAISELGWDGSIKGNLCQGDCEQEFCEREDSCQKQNSYSDFIGLVEVNTGRGNSHLMEREIEFFVSLEQGLVKRKLIYFAKNPTEFPYELFLRVVVNVDSGFGKVEVTDLSTKEELFPESHGSKGTKELGVYVELLPKQTKTISFNWESGMGIDFDKTGQYSLEWRKQAGVLPIPLSIRIDFPKDSKFKSDKAFVLTEEGSFGYNTQLVQDFTLPIFW